MKKISVNLLGKLVLTTMLVAGSAVLFASTAFAANKVIDFTGTTSQVFALNQTAEALVPGITITDDDTAATITAANDIRIIIPASATNTTFDTDDLTVTVTSAADIAKIQQTAGGAACGASPCTVTVALANSNKTMIIPVGVNFAAGSSISISTGTITLETFTADYDDQGMGLSADGDDIADLDCGAGGATLCGTVALTPGEDISVGTPTIASAASQAFAKNQDTTTISTITVTDDAVNATINTLDDIRITIPSGSNFVWDSTDTTATIGGADSGKVSTTVSYEDSNRTLVVNVTTNFGASGVITIAGLSYTTFSGAAANDNLDLDVANTTGVTATDSTTVGVGAPTIASAASQAFAKNQDTTAISTITVTDDGSVPVINTLDDIRITIPSGSNFVWDSTDTTATIGGADSGKVSTTVSYEDSNRTLVVNVTTNFGASGVITIAGLSYTTFSGAAANDNLDLDVANTAGVTATDSTTVGVGAPTIASAANQIFVNNQATTAISTITVTDDGSVPVINTLDDIRITIPSGSNFVWDSTDTTATIGGADSGKVSTTVSYEDSNRTLVVNVTTNFGASGAITIAGLSYKTFSGAAASDNLDLDVANTTGVTAVDSRTIIQGAPTIASSASQTFYVGMSSQPLDWTITVTESATAPGINTTNDIIIRIPTAFNMQFDPSDTSVVVAGTDWAKVEVTEGGAACGATNCAVTAVIKQADTSTACTGAAGSLCKTLRIPVDTNWDASDTITITGAKVFEFTATSDADNLELEAAGSAYGSSPTALDSATVTVSTTPTAGGTDHTGPSAPTGFKAEVDADNHIVLTWTDPTNTDLSIIHVLRGVGSLPVSGEAYANVNKGVKTYTDTDVEVGETIKYILRGVDTAGNNGSNTEMITITIEEGAVVETIETETGTEEAGTEEAGTEGEGEGEEEPAAEPVVVTTESGTTVTLEDVTDHWAEPEITAMTEQEVVQGNASGEFNPDGELNRAEAAAILCRIIGLTIGIGEPPAAEEAPFADVAVDAWYAKYISALKLIDLVSGQTETTYAPGANMNRAEFLQLAMNVYHFLTGTTTAEDQATTDAFADLDTTAWYTSIVSEGYDLGFIHGSTCAAGTCFNAANPITRAEATKILYNMFYAFLTAPAAEETPAEPAVE